MTGRVGENVPVQVKGGWQRAGAGVVRAVVSYPHARAVAAVSLGAAGLVEALVRGAVVSANAQSDLVYALLALACTLPLAGLGPVAAAAIVIMAATLDLAGFNTLTVAGFAGVLAGLYRLGGSRFHPAVWGVAAAVVGPIPFLVLTFAGSAPMGSEAGVLTVLLIGATPVAALGGVAHRALRDANDNRAARQVIADRLIEHTARGERARIARELHDVVAHHISMVVVQSESARLAVPGMPAAGAQRLAAIGDTARAALDEMRRLLGVLRQDAGVDYAERRPQPGLTELNQLIDDARAVSGSGTRLILRGVPVTLDPGVELVAFRIVQEALTNARRYAPGAAVDVELLYLDDQLRLRIRDNGPGPEPVDGLGGGNGLTGMRERAAAVGGRVSTGPAAGGGFVVEATLPAVAHQPLVRP